MNFIRWMICSVFMLICISSAVQAKEVMTDVVAELLVEDVYEEVKQDAKATLCPSVNDEVKGILKKHMTRYGINDAQQKDFFDQVKTSVKMSCGLFDPAKLTDSEKKRLINVAVNNARQAMDVGDQKKQRAIDQALSIGPDAFKFHFNLGYAFTSVNSLWSKGNPRVALGLYRTFLGTNIQLASQIKLTDAGEQQPVALGTGGKISAERALDFETLMFFPFINGKVNMYGKDRGYFLGPTALWGAKKLDANNLVSTRHYFGLRTAVGPESYVDVMVGRSEGVAGTRLLLRGKMPFNIPDTDQIIYLGLEGNIKLTDRKNSSSAETIRGYLVWDIDNILSIFEEKKE